MDYKKRNEELTHQFVSVWDKFTAAERKKCFEYAEGYKRFLDAGKTERKSAAEIRRIAVENGYRDYKEYLSGELKLKKGAKLYAVNRDKSIVLFHLGSRKIREGLRIVGAHIDSPRLDLKPFPLYEDSGLGFLKTHYYGGIKKYQWTTIPLALHGVVFKKDGSRVDVTIGEDDNDPVFTVTDLLPHLGKDQAARKLGEAIEGEQLNILCGSIPLGDDNVKEKIRFQVLNLLNERYGITEKDFMTAELEVVPAGKARDVGFDRSMVSAYGHDDRVCSYTGLTAMLALKNVEKTACGMFMDKEEVGSDGNTGSQSRFFENVLAQLIALQEGKSDNLDVRFCISNTEVLSGDVGAAFDPNYAVAYDKKNSAILGNGVQLVKYTGARGKGGCNDANAEFLFRVREVFDKNDIVWQIGELGKVDQGGGGTIAFILANLDAEVVDCGVPVLSMHAPYEVISKGDLYMTHKAYHAFLAR